jgi:site-specific recombinase XerD
VSIQSFLNEVRQVIRLKHLSIHTEKAYLYRIRDFIYFQGRKHPAHLGVEQIRAYLTHLAVEEEVAASTQN